MRYKSIMLSLLQEQVELHEQLRQRRLLLPAMENLALALKCRHEAASRALTERRPDSDKFQISNEALEIAIQQMEEALPSALPASVVSLPSDDVMAFLRSRLPPE